MPIAAQVIDARVSFTPQALVQPLRLSSGEIREVTEARARVTVSVGGRRGVGYGSIYLSHPWAWPVSALPLERRDDAMRRICLRIAENLPAWCGSQAGHPLELGLRLHEAVCHGQRWEWDASALALGLCASPFDAALHDAVGQALGVSAFALYGEDAPIPAADGLFEQGACRAIRQMMRPVPMRRFAAWWVVSGGDVEGQTARGCQRGYRCFKLKLTGAVLEDVRITRSVHRAALRGGGRDISIVGDSNQANPDAASVGEYLQQLRAEDPAAFASLQYLEQPTHCDIVSHRFDWRPVTNVKPVLIDEGLTSLELLAEAMDQGWSGFALKTCKGHSMAMAAAAWAHQHGALISLADLTNPGYAAVHAALFGAYVPTINGVELNSPQFTPAANQAWLGRLSGLFEPVNGEHVLPDETPAGLGSRWGPEVG